MSLDHAALHFCILLPNSLNRVSGENMRWEHTICSFKLTFPVYPEEMHTLVVPTVDSAQGWNHGGRLLMSKIMTMMVVVAL